MASPDSLVGARDAWFHTLPRPTEAARLLRNALTADVWFPELLALPAAERVAAGEDFPWVAVVNGVLDYPAALQYAAGGGPERLASPLRPLARVVGAVMAAMADGHTAVTLPMLLQGVARLEPKAPLSNETVGTLTDLCLEVGALVLTGDTWLQTPRMAALEADLAFRLHALRTAPSGMSDGAAQVARRALADAGLRGQQHEACDLWLRERLSVVTGPAGTGKSRVLQTMLAMSSRPGQTPLVAGAPSGKAAELLTARGVPAQTLNRLCGGLTPAETWAYSGPARFVAQAAFTTESPFLAVDEASMLDTVLAQRLLARLVRDDGSLASPRTRLVLLGDVAQLPSVGPGAVFADLLDAPDVPRVRLAEIHRTQGRLSQNGLHLAAGALPEFTPLGGDSPFLSGPSDDTPATLEGYAGELVTLLTRTIPEHYGVAPETVQLLVPQETGPLGWGALGAALAAVHRDVTTPDGLKLRGTTRPAQIGDLLVMLGTVFGDDGAPLVVNGQTLRVVGYTRAKTRPTAIQLSSETGRVVSLPTKDVSAALAYATTVHRAQGSEWPVGVSLLHRTHARSLCTRNSLYTGYTRFRTASILAGDLARVKLALDTPDVRTTTLRWRLAALAARATRS